MISAAPANLHILPSFAHQELCPDGIHLNPVSGLHYILHLFDQAAAVINLSEQDSEVRLGHVQEAVRKHDDRLAYLESRHGRLASSHDFKIAADAEFRDWQLNRSEEDWLTILGLPRLSVEGKREWQDAVKKQINEVFRMVLKANRMNLNYKILFAVNPLKGKKGMPVLNVRMDSVESSQRLRDVYSAFFRRVNPVPQPPSLKPVSVKNKVTLDTRIRITILQELGAHYKSVNPGSSIQVRGYDARPSIVIFPAAAPSGSGASARPIAPPRPQRFTFLDAVRTLPINLSDDSLAKIYQTVGAHHQGTLREMFVILSDDDRERCSALAQSRIQRRNAISAGSVSVGQVSGSGSGVGLEAGFLSSIRQPPPPPPSTPTARATPHPPTSSELPMKPGRKHVTYHEDSRSRSPSPAKNGSKKRQRSASPSRRKKVKKTKKSRSKSKSKKSRRHSSSSSSSSSGSASGSSSGSGSSKR